ncbi:MAG TPA: DUF126 domain-containing protein [Roseiarcus sp.]|nr:DUF126 domain-containing protein [Roseiarcus sp.]
MIRYARFHLAGEASAPALVLAAPLSFWGGVAVETGEIIDRSHPDLGQTVSGRILIMTCGRGSSSSSSVLAETIRRGVGPLGVILARPDPILTVGAIVAKALYDRACPIAVGEIAGVATGDFVRISAGNGDVATIEIRAGKG